MKVYNTYVLTLAVLLLTATVVLTALGVNSLDIYFTSYVIASLAVTELFAHLNSKARHGLSFIAVILLFCFLIMVSLYVTKTAR